MILLLLLTLTAHAEDFQVEVNPNTYSQKDFAAKGVKTGTIPERKKRPDALPNKSEREGAFAEVKGLDANLANMDELDRDVLYVRAKTKKLTELKQLYPKIPATQLAQLIKITAKP
jgi:hypothetical protein